MNVCKSTCMLPSINPKACDHCSINLAYKNTMLKLFPNHLKQPENIVKPPLGVMPRWLHNEKRIQDLTRALNDYAIHSIKDNKALMLEWTKELTELLEEGDLICQQEDQVNIKVNM